MTGKETEIDLHEELEVMAKYHAMVADSSYSEIEKIRQAQPDNKYMKDYYRDRMNQHRKWHDILKKLAKNV